MGKLLQLINGLKTKLDGIEGATDALSQVDELLNVAGDYDSLDPNAARTAIAQVETLQTQVNELKPKADKHDELVGQVETLTTGKQQAQRDLLAARTVSSAGVLPEFRDLIEPQIAVAAVPNDKGEFGLPEKFIDGLKGKYPSAFAAADAGGTGGAGNGGQGSDTSTTQPQTVKAQSGVVSGVNPEDVMSGKVKIEA
jgi:hypothetical protein